MLNEVIGTILEAEAKAEEIVAKANNEAKEISAKADTIIYTLIKEQQVKLKDDVDKVILEGEKQAQVAVDSIISEGKQKAEQLKTQALKKVSNQATKVLGRLI